MHTLPLSRPCRSRETQLFRAGGFTRAGADDGDAFVSCYVPHGTQDTSVWTWFDDGSETSVLFHAVDWIFRREAGVFLVQS